MTVRLTKKQKGFIKDFIKTENGTQAVLKNYNTKDALTASVIASQNLSNPKIKEQIKSIADSIPNELLIEKHLELLNKKDNEGNIDINAVRPGLDMAYKLKGVYAQEKPLPPSSLTITVDDKTLKIALKYEQELKEQL